VKAIEEAGAQFDGPALAPFRYSADSHMGISGLRVSVLQNGLAKSLTPVLTTDIGDAPIVKDDSGAASDAPPEDGIPTG